MAKRVNYADRVEDGELDLSMSDLQEVPVRDIALAKKAISLDLSNNRLTNLGKNFTTLTHLIKLDLSKNQISVLPSNFGDLVLLKHLDLYSNKLNHLPLSFGRLKNLKWLDLKDNPLVPALQEIAGPCLDSTQCQNCAKRVVQVLADAQVRVDQEQQKLEKEQKEREMVEKAAAKKEQQKNKQKGNNPQKKKNSENGVRNQDYNRQQKKKDKTKAKVVVPKSSSFFGRLIGRLFKLTIVVSIVLAVLYWVDVERFRQVQTTANRVLDQGIALLPPQTFVYLNQTSTFLNTDPRVKDYWANLRGVAYVVRDRASNAIATFMAIAPIYANDAKKFIMNALNSTKT